MFPADNTCSLSGVINKWRESIDLEPIEMMDGPNLASALQIPFTYCWSPALVPKPLDWPSHIGIESSRIMLSFLADSILDRYLWIFLSLSPKVYPSTGP